MAPPPPRGLMDDLIVEILLRLPPEDPECLVRASVVCKAWRRLLSDPSFTRRYPEFHKSPPLLGFFQTELRPKKNGDCRLFPCFIPITEASPSPIHNCQLEPEGYIFDCRHGRLLLFNIKTGFVVWDPITNSQQHIGVPKTICCSAAAVLCAVDGCDHLGCRGGPSLVVCIDIDFPYQQQVGSASAIVYSTETGAWNAGVSSVQFEPIMYGCGKRIGSRLLAGDALYFILEDGRRILKYDLAGCGLSLMSPPPLPVGNMVLMKAEAGGLGACGVEDHSLHLWAWRTGPSGISEWERGSVIQLDIGGLCTKLDLVDFAEGAGSIFVRASNDIFAVQLNSGRTRKIGKGGDDIRDKFPFMSFYTPEILLPPDQSSSDDVVISQII